MGAEATPLISESEQQTLVQIEPRGARGITGKAITTAIPVFPVLPVVEAVYQCYLV